MQTKAANGRLNRRINLTIPEIVNKVNRHYNSGQPGCHRLPALAIHAVMSLLTRETERYRGCTLLPLERSSIALQRKRLIGDVNIVDSRGLVLESYLVKNKTPINPKLIRSILDRLRGSTTDRLYILNTSERAGYPKLEAETWHFRQVYGHQVVFDNVDRTLACYLRLVNDTREFVNEYVSLLETDPSVTFRLKQAWNEIVGA